MSAVEVKWNEGRALGWKREKEWGRGSVSSKTKAEEDIVDKLPSSSVARTTVCHTGYFELEKKLRERRYRKTHQLKGDHCQRREECLFLVNFSQHWHWVSIDHHHRFHQWYITARHVGVWTKQFLMPWNTLSFEFRSLCRNLSYSMYWFNPLCTVDSYSKAVSS